MDKEKQSWLLAAPLATLLLCGAAAIFFLGYVPEAKKAREFERKVVEARRRIRELTSQENRIKQRIAELEAGVPETVEEALREGMRLGGLNDFLPSEEL